MKGKIRKIIPALDITDLNQLKKLIKKIADVDFVYGYKVGFTLGLTYGLPKIVDTIKSISDKPIIYDHQKAATDIPDTGKLFAKVMKDSGMDEVILFPQAGPATLEGWVKALQDQHLKVIVGGIMTHPKFVVSEGGFITDESISKIYSMSHSMGVHSFVVPLTKPDETYNLYEQAKLDDKCVFYSPGFGKQGGDEAEFGFLKTHYLIIGRSLLEADNPVEYIELVRKKIATKKLMIVDDSSIIRRIIKRHVDDYHLEIVGEASNGETALEIFRRKRPDIVTMDIVMPRLDGLSVIREMAKIDRDVKIIAVTSLADKATGIEAIKSGAKSFVIKPFSADKLQMAFSKFI
ncbi:MAG: response regulator [Calditrichaceae bacterium]|nr:response regulator [Calditrichaceae bacterium]